MPKLRKMLGNSGSPYIVSLMNALEGQSKQTIARWCLDYAQKEILPIYEKAYSDDARGAMALEAANKWLTEEIKLPAVKKMILAAHTAAREAEENPSAQAAIRAVAQVASVVHVATHALGLAFYGAAAIAYDRVGLNEKPETYDKIAAEECAKMESALLAISVANESNPAKLNWHC